jgi:hypothetical protein
LTSLLNYAMMVLSRSETGSTFQPNMTGVRDQSAVQPTNTVVKNGCHSPPKDDNRSLPPFSFITSELKDAGERSAGQNLNQRRSAYPLPCSSSSSEELLQTLCHIAFNATHHRKERGETVLECRPESHLQPRTFNHYTRDADRFGQRGREILL